jgi:NAD(P)-dependent dehydrogenase (short-subunit alcohol dehydrogenase family)
MGRLDGKSAIITGAASGIGQAIVRVFAAEAASVVIADIDEVAGCEVAKTIQENGGKATFIHGDVSSACDCEKIVRKAVETYGGIDILVNNAGTIRRATALDTTEAEWDREMATNVKSVFLMSKMVIPYMISAHGGSIINMGSALSLTGGRQALSYCAAKAAVLNMSRAMALDHGDQNIRVNCLCPGDTDTKMLQNEVRQLGCSTDDFMEAAAARRPLGRLATPLDIAKAALFLACDDSAYITGINLPVDGGAGAGSGTTLSRSKPTHPIPEKG